jgi:hypothetical protein
MLDLDTFFTGRALAAVGVGADRLRPGRTRPSLPS